MEEEECQKGSELNGFTFVQYGRPFLVYTMTASE